MIRVFRFMNYGFEDGNSPDLNPSDEVNRLFIQLYSMNLEGLRLRDKTSLKWDLEEAGG